MASRNAKGRMIYWKISYSKQLSRCTLLSKLVFTWLIPNTDDLGRMEGEPEIIKGMVFPYDEKISVKQISGSLEELSREKLIEWYQVDENYYIQFPNFTLYQKLRSDRIYKSDYPNPYLIVCNHEDVNANCKTCPDMTCQVGQKLREVKGSEVKGSEGEEKRSWSEAPYCEIIDYLNIKTGKSFSPKTDATMKFISGRWAEGKTLEDFKQVIDTKCSEWVGKKDREGKSLENFLRPNTLFSPTNFENYLNQVSEKPSKTGGNIAW